VLLTLANPTQPNPFPVKKEDSTMPDNPITENAPLDAEDWQIAFEPYAQFPILALVLAQHLTALQDYVQSDAEKAQPRLTVP
jgi:hypothetical protein